MAWRDELRPASFREVPFGVQAHDSEVGGRRGEQHQYPNRNTPYFEDLGRQADGFSFDAFVVGADYMARRDALVTACRADGPGQLVHPFLGTVEVFCTGCRVVESTREGRMARFRLSFAEAGRNLFPATVGELAEIPPAGLDAALQGAMTRRWQVAQSPQWVVDAVAQRVRDLSDRIRALSARVRPGGDPLSEFIRSVETLKSDAITLAVDGASLATAIRLRIRELGALSEDSAETVDLMRTLYGWGEDEPEPPELTPNRTIQAEADQALVRFTSRQAAVEAATAATKVQPASYGAAVALRNQVVFLIDAEIDAASADGEREAYESLRELLARVVRRLTEGGAELARVTTTTPAGELSALLVAYQLYGDPERAREIAARNAIQHPAFLPAGQALEVLSA